MLWEIIFTIVGFGAGHIFHGMMLSKNRGLAQIIQAAKKKNMLVFLESKNSMVVRQVVKKFQSIGITSEKEIVILPESSLKVCTNLGMRVAFGDWHRAVTVPSELVKFRAEWKDKGLSDEELGWLVSEIHDKSGSALKKSLEDKKLELNTTLDSGKGGTEEKTENKTLYNVYEGLSFAVKDFIFTGMNQTTIVAEHRNLVAQRELEKMGKSNLWTWGIVIFLIIVGLGLFGPDVIRALGTGAPATAGSLPANPLTGVLGG